MQRLLIGIVLSAPWKNKLPGLQPLVSRHQPRPLCNHSAPSKARAPLPRPEHASKHPWDVQRYVSAHHSACCCAPLKSAEKK